MMSTSTARSLDVAETATVDMMALNNRIVSMRNTVKQARVRVVRKLIRQLNDLRKKKGTEAQMEKNKRKADRLLEEMQAIKHLKPDKISKFALGNTICFAELCKQNTVSIESRALTRLSENQVIQKSVEKFRNSHPDWKSLTAFLLMKQSGRRYKKKKNKATAEKIDTNIKARETMMQTYLQKKLGSGADTETVKSSDSVKLQERKNVKKKGKVIKTDSVGDEKKTKEKTLEIDPSDSDVDKSESESSDEGVESESSADSDREDRLKAWGDTDSDSDGEEDIGTDMRKSSPSKNSPQSKTTVSHGKKEVPNPKKSGLKLEVLKQMFPSRTSSSESDSEGPKPNKNVTNTKLKSKILKEMLPNEDDSDGSKEESSEGSDSESEGSESDDSAQNRKQNKLKDNKVNTQQRSKRGEMVVKKISLHDLEKDEDLKAKPPKEAEVPDILLSEAVPEVKKRKDAFFADSDDSDEDDEKLDEASSEGSSSDMEGREVEEKEGMGSFDSTFIGTLAHKRKLKKGDHLSGGQESTFSGRGGSYRGRGGRGRSDFVGGKEFGFRGRGRGRGSNFRGRGQFKDGYHFKDRSNFPREGDSKFGGDRGRGRKDFRGRGSRFRGQGSGFRGHGSAFRGHGTERGNNRKQFSDQSFQSKERRENSWSNNNQRNHPKMNDKLDRGSKSEVLHPSWEASKRKKEQSTIHAFQGKKIKFDD